MASVTAFEAKTRFGELLKRVGQGEEIVITRHERPVARLVPEGDHRLESVRQAVRDLRATRERVAAQRGFKPLSDREIQSAIQEGRR